MINVENSLINHRKIDIGLVIAYIILAADAIAILFTLGILK